MPRESNAVGKLNRLVAKKRMECCRSGGGINTDGIVVPGDIEFHPVDSIGGDPAARLLSGYWWGGKSGVKWSGGPGEVRSGNASSRIQINGAQGRGCSSGRGRGTHRE